MQTLSNYEALLALSTSPTFTPVVREYLTALLGEHREMVAALNEIAEGTVDYRPGHCNCGRNRTKMRIGEIASAALAKVGT